MKKIISILVIMALVTIVLFIHHVNASELYLPLRSYGFGQLGGGAASMAIDHLGNMYMSDPVNHRIQKFSPDGKFVTKWGTNGNGQGQFLSPFGICVDSSNNIYVTDYVSNRIQKFDTNGNFMANITSNQLSSPEFCAIDSSNNIYVTNSYSILKLSPNGNNIGTWSDSNDTKQFPHSNPLGIAIDSFDNIFVVNTSRDQINEFTKNQTLIKTIGSTGNEDGKFSSPQGIAIDSIDNIYVTDINNHRIQKFSPDGKFVTKWVDVNTLYGAIAVDSSGNAYLEDNYALNVLSDSFTPIANPSTVSTTQNNGTNFTLTGFVDSTQTQAYPIVTRPLHGVLTGTPPNLSYTPNLNFFGNDSFTFKIHEGIRDSNVATVSITVNAGKYPPQVNTGLAQTISSGSLVALDGSKSYDIDGDKLTYSWLQTAGTPVILSDKTSSQPTFTAPTVNTDMILTFVLTVNDGTSSNSTSITVTVKPSSSQPVQNATTPSTNNTVSVPTISNTGIIVSTDKSSYNRGDTIIISTKLSSHIPNQAVTIRVLNGFQNPVDIALLTPAPDGSATTKLLATGPLWQTSGTYTIIVQYNSTVKTLTAFYFNSGNGTSSANNVTSTQSTTTTSQQTTPQPNPIQPLNQVTSATISNATLQYFGQIASAKYNHTIAAEVFLGNQNIQTKTIDNNITVQANNISQDSINVIVSASNQTSPKVLLFNLENTTINIGNLKYLGIMYDGKPIQPASDVNSLLHGKSTDDPKYAIIVTQSGAQILILVPHFSTHTITITNMSKVIPVVPEFPLAILTLIIATFSIILIPRLKQII